MPRMIDVVEVPNQGPNEMVVRVPEYDSGDFRFGSQVIVRESQRAVFYRDGHSLDLFQPGRHTITTANMPFLSSLLKIFTGGDDVFTAEVYFVNMREFTDLKWGTPHPITLRDADMGVVRLRAFGQYTMQITDPKRFVDHIVGTQGMYQTSQIEDYLRGAVVSRLTDVMGENMTSLFDLASMYDEISAAMRAKIYDDFAAMGVEVKQFMIVSINPTEETAKAIDERASMGAIGDMDSYMKFKAARAIGDAAASPGGGGGTADGLGMGAGIGMGAGMAGMIAQAMQPTMQPGMQPAAQPAVQAQPAVGTAYVASAAPSVMTLEEAAAYLKVAPADIQALIDEGGITAKRIGSQVRISRDVIDAFMAS